MFFMHLQSFALLSLLRTYRVSLRADGTWFTFSVFKGDLAMVVMSTFPKVLMVISDSRLGELTRLCILRVLTLTTAPQFIHSVSIHTNIACRIIIQQNGIHPSDPCPCLLHCLSHGDQWGCFYTWREVRSNGGTNLWTEKQNLRIGEGAAVIRPHDGLWLLLNRELGHWWHHPIQRMCW